MLVVVFVQSELGTQVENWSNFDGVLTEKQRTLRRCEVQVTWKLAGKAVVRGSGSYRGQTDPPQSPLLPPASEQWGRGCVNELATRASLYEQLWLPAWSVAAFGTTCRRNRRSSLALPQGIRWAVVWWACAVPMDCWCYLQRQSSMWSFTRGRWWTSWSSEGYDVTSKSEALMHVHISLTVSCNMQRHS